MITMATLGRQRAESRMRPQTYALGGILTVLVLVWLL
jgi:hypothetical protein